MKSTIIEFILLLITSGFVKAESWKVYKMAEAPSPANDITAICFDKKGVLWLGTSYGVYRQNKEQWILDSQENIYVQSLYIDKNDNIWAGLWSGGVWKSRNGEKWTNIPEASKSSSVNYITADQHGGIWVGDWNEGLFTLARQSDGTEKWVNIRGNSDVMADTLKMGDNAILSIFSDSKNKLWLGSHYGLSTLENNQWKAYNVSNSPLPDNQVYAISADISNNVWVGTGNGLVKISSDNWQVFNDRNSGLTCDLVLSLATDSKGNIWAGTNKGAFFFNGKTWTNFTVENSALPDNRIQTIKINGNKVYFGTSHGLAVYEP